VAESDRTVMSDPRDVVVIGAGFAGLSAGVALAEQGFRVAVLERRPTLGGRAYSFADAESGDAVDNGQHVLMGCYTETLDFLKKIGSDKQLVFRPRLDIELTTLEGARGRLRAGLLPGPMHMASALLRYRLLSPRERLGVLGAGLRLLAARRFAPLGQTTVAELLAKWKQSNASRERFWYPLAIATLNDEPAQASAALLVEVWRRAFFGSRRDSAFVYSKVGLSQLYCETARQFIEQRGGVVAPSAGVERLELDGERAVGRVRLRDGRSLEAANFISSVTPGALLAMLPPTLRAEDYFSRLATLSPSPIVCVHVWMDRPVTDAAFVGFIGTTTQWLFNKSVIFARKERENRGGYLSFVISGARALVDRSNEELLDLVMKDLYRMVPAAREAKFVKALVLKEKQATIAPTCDSQRLRPPVTTPIDNLFLAGDWIQTGLPATIESAVIAGRAAAAAVRQRVGHVSRIPEFA